MWCGITTWSCPCSYLYWSKHLTKLKWKRSHKGERETRKVSEPALQGKGPATSPDDPSQSLGPIEKERTETHKLSSDFHTCTVECMNHTAPIHVTHTCARAHTRVHAHTHTHLYVQMHMPWINRVQNREIIHNKRKHILWKLDRKQCVGGEMVHAEMSEFEV